MIDIQLLYGPVYWKTKNQINNTSYLPRKELKRYSDRNLIKLVNYALKSIPYYKNSMEYPDAISNLEPEIDFIKLPLLSKETVKSHLKQFCSSPGWRGIKKNTGGSTGEPFVFYLDRFVTRQKEKAFIFDQWGRIGYRPGESIFNLRGTIPEKGKFIKHDILFNIYSASSIDLTVATLSEYIDYLNKLKPKYLHGYPSTIFLLSKLMKENKITLDFQLNGVFCGSEKMFPYQREIIEKIFNCRVFSWYGHSEYQVLGGECEYSNKLHLYPQYGHTELLKTGHKDEKGRDIFEIVATGYNNYFMPLLRYRTMDYAIISENQECECKRQFILLDEVIGRVQEFIVDCNENLISITPLIYGQHYEEFEGMSEFQIIQEKPGEIEILIESQKNSIPRNLEKFVNRIRNLLGDRMNVVMRLTDNIEKTQFGKKKTVIQSINISQYL